MAYDYDITIIGGGSGGLSVAAGAAKLGAKVLLIDNDRLGGDCLWWGCVPSKALIKAAKTAKQVRTSAKYGTTAKNITISFPKAMQYVKSVQKSIEPHDSPERFEKLGCTVKFGSPSFIDDHTINLNNKKISSKFFVISTGSRAAIPPIDGLKDAGYIDNIGVFKLKHMPKSLAVVGAGPIGMEMTQCFARLGCNVTVLVRGDRIMSKDDADAAKVVEKVMASEGVTFLKHASTNKITKDKNWSTVRLTTSDIVGYG